MKKNKLHDYLHTGGEHTLSIVVQGVVEAQTQAAKDCVTISTTFGDEIKSIVKINPNKYKGDLFRFSDFCQVFEKILSECGITEYRFIRTDFRLDNYAPRQYEMYSKLNRYLIAALFVAYGVRNRYRSDDLLTLDQVTQVIKCRDFEVENYDRAAKNRLTENHSEPAQYRFEIRTMASGWRKIYSKAADTASNMDLFKSDLLEIWFERFDAILPNLDKVQDAYNTTLEQKWHKSETAETKQYRSLTDFVMQNQGVIFSKKQLIDFYRRVDKSGADPVQKATNYKKRYGIEFFSKADIRTAIQSLKRAIIHFCER